MERQKLWICISIAFLLFAAVIAAVLISAPKSEVEGSARFVSAKEREHTDTTHAYGDMGAEGAVFL